MCTKIPTTSQRWPSVRANNKKARVVFQVQSTDSMDVVLIL